MVRGSFFLFRFRGVGVFMHWSWLAVAFFEVVYRERHYSSLFWNAAEYLTLFVIVLLHEFGHALACRQVGGMVNRIVLWPLGGVALVAPPPRPWPWLWCIAAGPLVNVALAALTVPPVLLARRLGLAEYPDFNHFLFAVAFINLIVLAFNLLPAYPLDGGQILFALLWAWLGRGPALLTASGVGLTAAAALALLAWRWEAGWLALMAAFMGFGAWRGLSQARALLFPSPGAERLERAAAGLERKDYAAVVADCTAALELLADPTARAMALMRRGIAWACLHEFDNAAADYDAALHLTCQPFVYVARAELCRLRGDLEAGHADLDTALRRDPDCVLAFLVRGALYRQAGATDRAVAAYTEVIRREPARSEYRYRRGAAHDQAGAYREAAADFEEAVRLGPDDAEAHNCLAWLLATCPAPEFRDGERALDVAYRACELYAWENANALGTLGAAYAEAGLFAEAIRWQERALESAQYVAEFGESARRRLALYAEGRAFRAEMPVAPSGV
jgi:Zn-dependent protease/Tfp pilus assembly protein PilF